MDEALGGRGMIEDAMYPDKEQRKEDSLRKHEKSKGAQIISVDFDGVLHSYQSGWKGVDQIPDPPVEGSLEWLEEISASGHFKIAIYSSRSKDEHGITAMENWIETWQIVLGLPQRKYWFPNYKPAALLTIDDRAIQFRGPGSLPSIEQMLEFKPWNRT